MSLNIVSSARQQADFSPVSSSHPQKLLDMIGATLSITFLCAGHGGGPEAGAIHNRIRVGGIGLSVSLPYFIAGKAILRSDDARPAADRRKQVYTPLVKPHLLQHTTTNWVSGRGTPTGTSALPPPRRVLTAFSHSFYRHPPLLLLVRKGNLGYCTRVSADN